MKIKVSYVPVEIRARYGYKSRTKDGKVIRVGVQFDPFEEFKENV